MKYLQAFKGGRLPLALELKIGLPISSSDATPTAGDTPATPPSSQRKAVTE